MTVATFVALQEVLRSMENLISISNFDYVKLNYNYFVAHENLSILTPTKGNRGGKDNKRINYYVNLIRKNKFDFDYNLITVDSQGNIIEGHNRVEACKITGNGVVVRICKPKSIVNISNINSGLNPNWRPEQSFNSAKDINTPAVLMLDEFRDNLLEANGIDKSKFSPNELYGILVKNTKHFGSGKNAPTIEMWIEPELNGLVNKNEFKRTARIYVQMKREFRNNRDAYKICKHTMDLHFDCKIDFDIFTFYKGVQTEGFILDVYNAETIKTKALAMYNKEVKKIKLAA